MKKQKITISVIGDEKTGKKKLIDQMHKASLDKHVITKQNQLNFDKLFNNDSIISLQVFYINRKAPLQKLTTRIAESDLVFLVFDLNNRESFGNLGPFWLNYLKNDCSFQNELCILGNYNFNNEETDDRRELVNSSCDLLTSSVEIQYVINMFWKGADYLNIGNLATDELIEELDKRILKARENSKNPQKEKCKEDGSWLKMKEACYIF
jgi:GTPase SAR1 family protein